MRQRQLAILSEEFLWMRLPKPNLAEVASSAADIFRRQQEILRICKEYLVRKRQDRTNNEIVTRDGLGQRELVAATPLQCIVGSECTQGPPFFAVRRLFRDLLLTSWSNPR